MKIEKCLKCEFKELGHLEQGTYIVCMITGEMIEIKKCPYGSFLSVEIERATIAARYKKLLY